MKTINNYIIEKLKINKDTKIGLNYPVSIEFWSMYEKLYILREDIERLVHMEDNYTLLYIIRY